MSAPSAPAPRPVTHYHVRHIERLRLGTTYPDVVGHVRDLVRSLGDSPELVVDATGVGRPVVELFELSRIYPIAVTLTAGDSVATSDRGYRVPKRDLVSAVEVLLQERRLKFAKDGPGTQALVDELLGFRATISATGYDGYAAGGTAHDDLVIALALAAWRARETERVPATTALTGFSEINVDRDDPGAYWLGDPRNRYALGRPGGGSRFIGGGCRGIPAPQYLSLRFR